MSSNSFKILESFQEKNINMCHFLLLPTTIFFSDEGKKKKRRKYIVSLKLNQSFILMIDEKAFADFIITGVLIFSFGGFYSYKMCMMRKLHKKIQMSRFTLGFHFLEKIGCTHAMLQTKNYDPDICHFLIVLHDQCNLSFEYSKTYKLLNQCQNH